MEPLPRYRLIDGPSPLQPLPRFSAALGGRAELWIKREDLLPLAFGGNKLRNLEYLVGAALAEGADALVTSGRRWSNHARLTAAAGAKAGLDVHLVLSGPPVEPAGPGVRLMRALGATVEVLPDADREAREARVAAVTASLRSAGRRPYVIGVGGSGMPGIAGQLDAGLECLDQLEGLPRGGGPGVIYLPSATGGTQAGLIAAASTAGAAVDAVVGVVVARPEAELRAAVRRMLELLEAHVGTAIPDAAIELDESQLGAGYGQPTAEAAAATDLLARTEGILTDPIYTAKALAALVADVRAGRLDGRLGIFWHAGGLPGMFEPLEPPPV